MKIGGAIHKTSSIINKFEKDLKKLRPSKFYCIFILQSETKQTFKQKKRNFSTKKIFPRGPRRDGIGSSKISGAIWAIWAIWASLVALSYNPCRL